MPEQCSICGKESTSRCSKCKRVYYCSRECQLRDWPNHKQSCNKIKRDYTSRKVVENYTKKNGETFQQDESDLTITIAIPHNCPSSDVHVRIDRQDLQVDVDGFNLSYKYHLYDYIHPSESTWVVDPHGTLIVVLHKRNKGIWPALCADHTTQPSTETFEWVERNWIAVFWPHRSRVSIMISIPDVSDTNAISNVEFRVVKQHHHTSTYCYSDIELSWRVSSQEYHQILTLACDVSSQPPDFFMAVRDSLALSNRFLNIPLYI